MSNESPKAFVITKDKMPAFLRIVNASIHLKREMTRVVFLANNPDTDEEVLAAANEAEAEASEEWFDAVDVVIAMIEEANAQAARAEEVKSIIIQPDSGN